MTNRTIYIIYHQMQTYFISGHINLTNDEFFAHYVQKINDAISTNNKFVLGNADGTDSIALDYLLAKGVVPSFITIFYHGYNKNHSRTKNYYTNLGLNVIDGFKSYTDRDSAMTFSSDIDIAWVRSPEETKKIIESMGEIYRASRVSGTEKNLIRRKSKLNK